MSLTLHNTLTRRKEAFEPIDPANVRMYVCGPTVYDHAHIGNARPVIVFDLLFRMLRHEYGAEHVTYVRNITDVDDKINARAAEEGVSIRKLTERTTAQFHADIAALGVLPPTHEPRATDHIKGMIEIISKLIERGHAYAADGHVLFHVPSMKGYGKLSGRSLDEMIAGARVEVAPYKKDAMDFVLWKPSPAELPGWESPWGRGRPGWHIECSAMSAAHLGERFDIHGGGIDLIFPHHENEIAQSRCAFGTDVMANVWMHNGFLQVEGQKMSKSLGNFITIHELLADWPGEVLRLNMLRTHYRQPIDWTVKGLEESAKMLSGWFVGGPADDAEFAADVLAALRDDLNTPQAIAEMHQLDDARGSLAAMGFKGDLTDPRASKVDAAQVEAMIAARIAARDARDWAESDRIRDALVAMGIQLKDGKDPRTGELVTSWEVKR
ncbi:MAG: cysteine--tRNA ligase [Aestuariivirgaceae bacterium]|nr:cysteine--tRNA ligase [Aestuariivirgaceae bacterium]